MLKHPVAIVLLSLIAALVGAELVLRLVYPVHFMAPIRSREAWFDLLHRRSDIPGLAYELKPGVARESRNGYVRTNAYGMRDDEPHPDTDRNILRIAGIGDSFTFGFHVDAEDAYPNILEHLLRDATPSRPADVLNLGVGGYSAADEALVVRHKALGWKPDLIVVGYVLNDPEFLPIQPLHRYFAEDKWYRDFHVTRLALKSWRQFEVSLHGSGDYVQYLHASSGSAWPTVPKAFADIGRVASREGIPTVLVIFPLFPKHDWATYRYAPIHRQVAAAAEAAGLDTLDLLDAYRDYEPGRLRVLENDPHPSRLGHRIAARAILRKLARDYADLVR